MTTIIQADTSLAAPGRAPAQGVARYLLRRPAFVVSAAVALGWAFVALAWRVLVPYPADQINPLHPFGHPSAAHLLGTDWLGRDVLSRTLAGSSSVLVLAPASALLAVAAGTAIGLVAGYYRGTVDMILMRITDAVVTIPGIILDVLVLATFGRSALVLVLVVAAGFAPLVSRTVRAAVLAERERDYIDAARLRQEPGIYIMVAEILPNVLPPVLVELTTRLGYAVFAVATLSFFGLGPQQPSPDWGLTVSLAIQYVQTAPWIVLAPAAAIGSLVVSVTILGDEIRAAVER
jgi:peptide/nickel transport system permease protein